MKKENLEVILEDINRKFDIVLEGHAALASQIQTLSDKTDSRFDLIDLKINTFNQKIDSVGADLSQRIDAVSADLSDHRAETAARFDVVDHKIDSVSADLFAHRADTEAHHGMYLVKEI